MINIYLIRHGKTFGNTLGRYIGRTDEHLCEAGQQVLNQQNYPVVAQIYASPMKRCVETAEIIYPGQPMQLVDGLRECDFGDFENLNYQELATDPDYQKWVDSGGTLPFPAGESQQQFRSRCCQSFSQVVAEVIAKGYPTVAVVAHGGTIMSILEKYAHPMRQFYDWQVKNGEGYAVTIDEASWQADARQLNVLKKLTIAGD